MAELPIRNVHRVVGTITSGEITRKWGAAGLPDGTIHFQFNGSAGQSFGAFLAHGVTLELEGDANDYVGKGLSGGKLIVYPPRASTFLPEENIVIGNVALYGATSGEAFLNGMAGERFAVRNSGATAVVEGLGDHGCEYMTNGLVVVIGKVGRNFAAGMSGGIAFVLDEKGDFAEKRCNQDMVLLERLDRRDEIHVRGIVRHHAVHGHKRARQILANWPAQAPHFVNVCQTTTGACCQQWSGRSGRSWRGPGRHVGVRGQKGRPPAPGQRRLKVPEVRFPETGQMGKPTGFIGTSGRSRRSGRRRSASTTTRNFTGASGGRAQAPGARCMDCGVPFCHTGKLISGMASGCPINNLIPEWNDLVYTGRWHEAYQRLHKTNNFPEFTGRVCPAPCEGSCAWASTAAR